MMKKKEKKEESDPRHTEEDVEKILEEVKHMDPLERQLLVQVCM